MLANKEFWMGAAVALVVLYLWSRYKTRKSASS